jgi:hypothetical protein
MVHLDTCTKDHVLKSALSCEGYCRAESGQKNRAGVPASAMSLVENGSRGLAVRTVAYLADVQHKNRQE